VFVFNFFDYLLKIALGADELGRGQSACAPRGRCGLN